MQFKVLAAFADVTGDEGEGAARVAAVGTCIGEDLLPNLGGKLGVRHWWSVHSGQELKDVRFGFLAAL